MSFDLEKLYQLLPAIYRLRDIEVAAREKNALSAGEAAELQDLQALLASNSTMTAPQAQRLAELQDKQQRGPLKALLAVIGEQVAVLEENLDQLYDDLFIETCAEWVVSYIGDLVGARGLFVFPNATFSQRAQVANTLAYRRRKGTASVLEQLARDLTQWDSSVVEYFQLLATTQYLNHLRPDNLAVADLRHSERLDYLNTPFDRVARTAEVRNIKSRRGKYNIPNVGVFLWRLGSYSITAAPAFRVDDRRYLFDALGKETQLYNRPEAEAEITHLAEPINVPMPLSRRALDRHLDAFYGFVKQGQIKSILIYRDGVEVAAPPASPPASPPATLAQIICACDLSDVLDAGGNVIGWAHMPQDKIAIDPVLGRIAFPASQPRPNTVHVIYHYGFSAQAGGGEYGRADSFSDLETVIKVPSDQSTLQAALTELANQLTNNPKLEGGVIEIEKPASPKRSPLHTLSGSVSVPGGTTIEIRAADEHRPVIVLNGVLEIKGGARAELVLNGLLVSHGSLHVPTVGNQLGALRLRHCTLLPTASPQINLPGFSPPLIAPAESTAPPRLVVELANAVVEIEKSIVGSLRATDEARVCIGNSIVDAGAESEVAYAALDNNGAGAPLKIENSTVIGQVHTLTLELASNTIFFAPVRTERLQGGCVRFSYLTPGSQTPRRHQCQPQNSDDAARVRPVFTSLRYGDAGYCKLSRRSAIEIRNGADDQAEMGAFHDLYQPQREGNLRAHLDEYVRFSIEAGILYAS